MTEAAALAGFVVVVLAALARPHGWGPALGAAAGVVVAAAGGAVGVDDLRVTAVALWRPLLTLVAIMTMTSAAEHLGLLYRVAAVIEPRTRGPVRRAFALTFALSAAIAASLSNDAAILLLTPVVLTLIRTVYPRRHPKFVVPFALAVFTAAGVAPLVTSNPMNLVVADRAGIGFNAYAAAMLPVAVVGWLVSYAVLRWRFREVLADDAPALGAWPAPAGPMTSTARAAVAVIGGALVSYPVVAAFDGPLWAVAASAAAACAALARRADVPASRLAGGVAWNVLPFLAGVFVLALALEHGGAVAWLAGLYDGGTPLPTIGVTSALGSAALNNHPMAVLNVLALDGHPPDHVLAALVGGDLGPRLSPAGSLAGLLWFDTLRRHGVALRARTFVGVGLLVTLPTLAASLATLWLVRALGLG